MIKGRNWVIVGGVLSCLGTTAQAPAPTSPIGIMADVRAYGAKGDGITDDTRAIQAALNAASTVVFPRPPAYYRLASGAALSIPDNRVLIGYGSRLRLEVATATGEAVRVDGTSNVVIEGLEIDVVPTVTGMNGIGIARSVKNDVLASHIRVQDTYVHGFKSARGPSGGVCIAIEVGARRVHVLGNRVEDCDYGIYVYGSTMYPVIDFAIAGNVVRSITNTNPETGYAIAVVGASAGPNPGVVDHAGTIYSNTIERAPVAFYLKYARYVSIVGNIARMIASRGVLVEEAHAFTFLGNTVEGKLLNFVRLQNASGTFGTRDCTIALNNFMGSASGDGVSGDTSAQRCYFAFDKMQSVGGPRSNLASAETNMQIDPETGATGGSPWYRRALVIANNGGL